ncbi:unnamed protein product, partial [Ixodes hexagonus]
VQVQVAEPAGWADAADGLTRRHIPLGAVATGSAQLLRTPHGGQGHADIGRLEGDGEDQVCPEENHPCLWRFPRNEGKLTDSYYIRQRLQRTATQGGRTSPRWSPVQGDHQLGGLAQQQSQQPPQAYLASPSTSPFAAPGNPTGPISIPAHSGPGRGSAVPRMRSSVEGLNQEIERLVLKGISGAGTENEAELERVMGPTPEGHRAPIAELFHSTCSVDTQTPSGSEVLPNGAALYGTSRPDSPDCDKNGSPEPEASSGQLSKLGTSPRINKFLAREPPDGCEKVKIIDEGRKHTTVPMAGDASDSISKPNSQFVLRPSQSSAFCPLVRNPFQGVQRAPPGTDPFLLNERLQ